MTTVLLMIVLMLVLIVPHEFGHFATAKLLGVQVNEFSIGMGPLLFQRQKGETTYSIRLFPIGGFCAMEGEDEESENPRAFSNKPAYAKLIVLFAGAAMNLLVALIIMTSIVTYSGIATNTIGTVEPGSPAFEAGLLEGDKIIKINESDVDDWAGVITELSANENGESVHVTVLRSGEDLTYDIKPELAEDDRYIIGIQTRPSHNVLVCSIEATKLTWLLNKEILGSFLNMFRHGIGRDDIAGPVGMASLVNDTAKLGLWRYFYLVSIISLNLAILNLLPFPALDGGRIVFIVIRKLSGDRITDDIEGYVHALGMLILIGLIILVTWNDITNLIGK